MEGRYLASIDIALFGLVCLLLFIYVVSYWFQLKYREIYEYFCPSMKCDYNLLNNRLKSLAVNIDYLGSRINEIEQIMPYSQFQRQIEGYEGVYSNLASLEKLAKRVFDKQRGIFKYYIQKNPGYKIVSKKATNIDCFQLKSADDCDKPEIQEQLKLYRGKLEEIEYRTNLYSSILDEIKQSNAEYEKARDKAINQSGQVANRQMAELTGQQVDITNNLRNGVSPDLEKAIKTGDNRAIQDKMLNDPEARKLASNIKPAQFTQNAEKIYNTQGTSAGQEYKTIGNNLISTRLGQSDRPDAKAEFASEVKKQDGVPPNILQI